MFSFSSKIEPGLELLDYRILLFLAFWGLSILFSIVAALIYNPTNRVQGFPFPHILTNICYLWSFDDSHSDRCEVISHWHTWVLICKYTYGYQHVLNPPTHTQSTSNVESLNPMGDPEILIKMRDTLCSPKSQAQAKSFPWLPTEWKAAH